MSRKAKGFERFERRQQSAGSSQLEMLMFRLQSKQRFGINVYKVREVLQCPSLTIVPGSARVLKGVITLRGITIPVIDLSLAVGMEPITDTQTAYIIVAEFNRAVQGFLVAAVERIVHVEWENVSSPPRTSGLDNYLTGVTSIDDDLVQILDVEKVFADVHSNVAEADGRGNTVVQAQEIGQAHVLIVDDSRVARKQIEATLNQLGLPFTAVSDGKQALAMLGKWAIEEPEKLEDLLMVIADIEMPGMDGYSLTREIRRDPRLEFVYVLLHSSLTSMLNKQVVERCGANGFVPKFNAVELAKAITERLAESQTKPAEL